MIRIDSHIPKATFFGLRIFGLNSKASLIQYICIGIIIHSLKTWLELLVKILNS